MARPVSQAFKDVWQKKQGGRDFRKVSYKRRYWNGSAFVYEANWTDLDDSKIIGVGSIPMQLDTPRANVYRTSQISVRLDNTNNEWIQGTAPPSVFAADAIATLGYRLYKTQVQVQFGYLKQDGTKEYTALFTGLIVRSRPTSKDDEIILEVTSRGLLLERADAEKVSLSFTLENCIPATGDGTNKEFETTSVGVDHLTDLQVNAVSVTQGTDYRAENFNAVAEPGTTGRVLITFQTAPPAGHTVKASGVKWKVNQKIEDLVADLCQEAGITSGERAITPVLFPGGLSGSKTIDTQAQWAAGSVLTNVSALAVPDSLVRRWFLVDDFSDLNYSSSPAWSVLVDEGSVPISAGTGVLKMSVPLADGDGVLKRKTISLPLSKDTGTWRFQALALGGAASGGDGSLIYLLNTATHSSGRPTGNGYALRISGHGSGLALDFYKVTAGVLSSIGSVGGPAGATPFEYAISRAADGTWKIYHGANGSTPTLALTVVDTTYTTFSYFMVMMHASYSSVPIIKTASLDFDTLYVSQETENTSAVTNVQAIYESAEFDLLSTPTAWGILSHIETLNGGSLVFKTAVASISGGPYDAYVAISGGGQIQSALKRYLKIRIEFTIASGAIIGPEVDRVIANFTVSTIQLALANFAGKTCFNAIEEFAQVSNYEIGFDGDGIFFFRPKTVGASILAIDQENAIIAVNEYDAGFSRVINVGRVRYNDYFNKWDGTDALEASPTSEQEYGRIVQDETYNLLLANDVNIGRGRAQAIYEFGYRPRRYLRLSTWIIPWLELSDVITVSVFDHPLLKQTVAGDPLQSGFAYFMAGEAQNVLARDLDMKVVEYKPNLDSNQAEILLEEVLT